VTLYLEDLVVGTVSELGQRSVSAEEIVAFAREFDPQPFHLDPEAARRSPFGGLVASGWHVSSIFGRLIVDGLFDEVANLAGLGLDEVRFLAPVRPGDTLSGWATIIATRVSQSRPGTGIVTFRCVLANQDGVDVWSATCTCLVRRRPDGTQDVSRNGLGAP